MWLLAGVRLLRALRMSHRFTFFHSAYCMCRFLLCWFVLFACVFCWFCLCLVLCFACAAGIFLTIVADVSR